MSKEVSDALNNPSQNGKEPITGDPIVTIKNKQSQLHKYVLLSDNYIYYYDSIISFVLVSIIGNKNLNEIRLPISRIIITGDDFRKMDRYFNRSDRPVYLNTMLSKLRDLGKDRGEPTILSKIISQLELNDNKGIKQIGNFYDYFREKISIPKNKQILDKINFDDEYIRSISKEYTDVENGIFDFSPRKETPVTNTNTDDSSEVVISERVSPEMIYAVSPEKKALEIATSELGKEFLKLYNIIIENYTDSQKFFIIFILLNRILDNREYTENENFKLHIENLNAIFNHLQEYHIFFGQCKEIDDIIDLYTLFLIESNNDLLIFNKHSIIINSMINPVMTNIITKISLLHETEKENKFSKFFKNVGDLLFCSENYCVTGPLVAALLYKYFSKNDTNSSYSSYEDLYGGALGDTCNGNMTSFDASENIKKAFYAASITKTYDELLHDFSSYFTKTTLDILKKIYSPVLNVFETNLSAIIKNIEKEPLNEDSAIELKELKNIENLIKTIKSYTV